MDTIKVIDGQEAVPAEEKLVEITTATVETRKFCELDAEKEAEIADIQKRIDGLTVLRDEKRAVWDSQKAKLT